MDCLLDGADHQSFDHNNLQLPLITKHTYTSTSRPCVATGTMILLIPPHFMSQNFCVEFVILMTQLLYTTMASLCGHIYSYWELKTISSDQLIGFVAGYTKHCISSKFVSFKSTAVDSKL